MGEGAQAAPFVLYLSGTRGATSRSDLEYEILDFVSWVGEHVFCRWEGGS